MACVNFRFGQGDCSNGKSAFLMSFKPLPTKRLGPQLYLKEDVECP